MNARGIEGLPITDNHQVADDATEEYTTINVNGGGTLGIARNAAWLRTEIAHYQQDGKGLWGRDITAALTLRAP